MDWFAGLWAYFLDGGWKVILAFVFSSALYWFVWWFYRPRPEERTEVAPPTVAKTPATTPEPQPSPDIYGEPLLVLTPNERMKRWYQAYLSVYSPGTRVVAQGEPGWEGFKLKPDDVLVIYRREVNDDHERTEKQSDDVPESILHPERGATDSPTDS